MPLVAEGGEEEEAEPRLPAGHRPRQGDWRASWGGGVVACVGTQSCTVCLTDLHTAITSEQAEYLVLPAAGPAVQRLRQALLPPGLHRE